MRTRCAATAVAGAIAAAAVATVGVQPAHATATSAGPGADTPRSTYQNPVLDTDFPDPAVLRVGTTMFAYATGATSEPGTQTPYIRMSRSTDLVTWTTPVTVMSLPAWAIGATWAPHVISDPRQADRHVMYFSAQADPADPAVPAGSGKCLGVATAQSPFGPFTPRAAPLRCGPGFANIDPMALRMPGGRHVLYWGSAGQPIRSQPLSDDLLSFAAGSRPTDVLAPIPGDKYAGLIEGAWVIDRGRYRYLFTSGSRCCSTPDGYAVTVARRDLDTDGPWVRYTDGDHGAILRLNGSWQAPGHNAVFVDSAGIYWIMYHARRPGQSRRVLMLDRIEWVDGWPRIATDSPSTRPVPGPAPWSG